MKKSSLIIALILFLGVSMFPTMTRAQFTWSTNTTSIAQQRMQTQANINRLRAEEKELKTQLYRAQLKAKGTIKVDSTPLIQSGAEAQIQLQIKAIQSQIEEDKKHLDQLVESEKNRSWENWLDKAGSAALDTTLRKVLNTLAYDTAEAIGSGAPGQKAFFETRNITEYFRDTADNAAGTFLETLGSSGGFLKFNLCEPDLALKMSIGLGLTRSKRPTEPNCSWTAIVSNWKTEISNVKDNASDKQRLFDMLKQSIQPTNTNAGIQLALESSMVQFENEDAYAKMQENLANRGWIEPFDTISNKRTAPAGTNEARISTIRNLKEGEILKVTLDPLKDAANVFINTLALTAFEKAMAKLGKNMGVQDDSADNLTRWQQIRESFRNSESSPLSSSARTVQAQIRGIMEAQYGQKADYDILAELSQCPDGVKVVGPNRCVIDDKFRQAIQDRDTVSQALKNGSLNGQGIFGFSANGLEPSHINNYPYRSMIILRKYRILPIGWEVAAQYIKKHQNETGVVTLNDMVACFDDDTKPEWCRGLVDPKWVLKAAQNFCKKMGAGPNTAEYNSQAQGENSPKEVSRDDQYCADEQSCIKEKADGTCDVYGYCTEDRRMWRFGGKTCEPANNSCMSYKSEDGRSVNYLSNTLDNGKRSTFSAGCNIDNDGCNAYCTSYDYANSVYICGPDVTDEGKIFLDKDAKDCDSKSEGCTKLIRARTGLGTNLITDSGFEESDKMDAESAINADAYLPDGAHLQGLGAYQVTDNSNGHQVRSGSRSLFIKDADNTSLVISAEAGEHSLFPESFKFKSQTSYSASAWVYLAAGESAILKLNSGAPGDGTYGGLAAIATTSIKNQWFKLELKFYTGIDTAKQISITINRSTAELASAYIDDLQLVEDFKNYDYREYGSANIIYEKLIPNYLEATCYQSVGANADYRLKDGAPEICETFVRKCNAVEENCEMYTSLTSKIKTAGVAKPRNNCPTECVGYDTYIQLSTAFDMTEPDYFIPKTAKTCQAASAGCTSFTNIDKSYNGGESTEYYSKLWQCVKPTDPDCSEFYSWEGSSETGYQLRVYSLKGNGAGLNDVEPRMTDPALDLETCTEDIYNKDPMDPAYNPDCREFYNKAGFKSYHLFSGTISCSDNCYPYRKNNPSLVKDANDLPIEDVSACMERVGVTSEKDSFGRTVLLLVNGLCHYCKDGGYWNDAQQVCLYDAIPNEGVSCSAQEVGCREYVGNTGNDVQVVLFTSFESGNIEGWTTTVGTAVNTNESLVRGGRAIDISAGSEIEYSLPTMIEEGSSYSLDFIGKTESSAFTDISVFIKGKSKNADVIVPVGTSTIRLADWKKYRLAVHDIAYDLTDVKLVIANTVSAKKVVLDDIKFSLVPDRYYLIRDSWTMPQKDGKDICNWDIINDKNYPYYSLGCDAYSDRDNVIHALSGFSQLCQESAVGCELMIDTRNSKLATATIINDLATSRDKMTYAVYDKTKQCGASEKGCTRLGQAVKYENQELFSDVFKLVDPDMADKIACDREAAQCRTWQSGDGSVTYFKDPGYMTCEYRSTWGSSTDAYRWLKYKVNRCDADGNGKISTTGSGSSLSPALSESKVCYRDADCGGTIKCVLDDHDYYCPVNTLNESRTLGLGGSGTQVYQPIKNEKNISTDLDDEYWVGQCPAEQSSCTEYLDPLSKLEDNKVLNPDFKSKSDGTNPDNWSSAGAGVYEQKITIDGWAAYSLSLEKGAGNNVITVELSSSQSVFREYDNATGEFFDGSIPTNKISFTSQTTSGRVFFNTGSDISIILRVESSNNDWENVKVFLNKSIVSYQLAKDVDKSSCNGVVNTDTGCVLFNERKTGDMKPNWDAFLSGVGTSPQSNANNNSNALIKVNADRICSKWLACSSFVKDSSGKNVCYDLASCNTFDKKNECANYVSEKNTGISNVDKARIRPNISGYAKVGYDISPLLPEDDGYKTPNDLREFSNMYQYGDLAKVSNSSFELTSSNGMPMAWSLFNPNVIWNPTLFSVINDPYALANENIGNPPDGTAYLKVGVSQAVVSDHSYITAGTDYVLTAYVNTLNMRQGTLRIDLLNDTTFNALGNNLAVSIARIDVSSSTGWLAVSRKFTSPADGFRVKIGIVGAKAQGNAYIDAITVNPVLVAGNGDDTNGKPDANNWMAKQSCRIYPDKKAPTCSYYDNDGIYKKGIYGYCLEYDRAPGDPNTCLLWWPVDRVMGNGETEGFGGYMGKSPLYYCSQLDGNFQFVESRKEFYLYSTTYNVYNWLGSAMQVASQVFSIINNAVNSIVPNAFKGPQMTAFGYNMNPLDGNMFTPDPLSQDGGQLIFNYLFTTGPSATTLSSPCPAWQGYLIRSQVVASGAIKKKIAPGVKIRIGTWYRSNLNCSPGISKPDDNLVATDNNGKKWYEYNGSLIKLRVNDKPGFNALDNQYIFNDTIGTGATVRVYKEDGVKVYDKTQMTFVDPSSYSPACKSFYKVTDDMGGNKAWLSRVSEGSSYTTNTGYAYDTQNLPYGSANVPAPESNPYEWDGNSNLEGVNPVTMKTEDPNSGLPYSCLGGKCENIGRCSNTGTLCIQPNCDDPKKCVWLNPPPNLKVDEYTNSGYGFTIWHMPGYNCPVGETCEAFAVPNNLPAAKEDIKRVFATSYGAYEWAGATGACQNSTSTVCNRGENPCPGGTCTENCVISDKEGNLVYYSAVTSSFGTCNANSCLSKIYYNDAEPEPFAEAPAAGFVTLNAVNTSDTCTANVAGVCGNNFIDCCGIGSCDVLDPANTDDTALDIYINASGTVVTNPNPTNCKKDSNGAVLHEEYQDCMAKYASMTNICTLTKQDCGNGNGCGFQASCEYYKCAGGENADQSCYTEQRCVNSTCVIDSSNSRYRADTTDPGWSVPTTVCQGAKTAADYCAIPPIVNNVKARGQSSAISISGSAYVDVSFNVTVDRDQLPLVEYVINWGDGTKTTVSGVELRDRSNRDNPFVVYHLYNYYYILGNGGSCANGSCTATPTISVKDNWGWCNGANTLTECGDDPAVGPQITVKQ